MVLKKYSLSIFLSILALALALILIFSFLPKKQISLETKTHIIEETRYIIEPIWHPQKNKIFFEIELESYQNKDSLEIDFSDQALLEDEEENLFKLDSWHYLSEQPNKIKALLKFKIRPESKTLTLKLFNFETVSETWLLKHSNEQN